MNNHERPLANPKTQVERSKRTSTDLKGFDPENKNIESEMNQKEDAHFLENPSVIRINNHGRPLSNQKAHVERTFFMGYEQHKVV